MVKHYFKHYAHFLTVVVLFYALYNSEVIVCYGDVQLGYSESISPHSDNPDPNQETGDAIPCNIKR